MTIRGRQTLTIVVVLASILAACTGTQSSPGASQPDGSEPAASGGGTATGGTVRIGLPGYPDSLNPGLAVLAESYTIYELVYDTPVAVTATGEWIPRLATEWSVSEDGLTWTMTLVEGATFHDGEPADADDVAFSVEFYRDNEFPLLTSYAEPFVEVTVVDPVTIELTTADPMSQPLFEQNMAAIYVLPEHIWSSEDPQEFGNEEMIGTGPFTLTETSQGEFVELATNPDYWGTAASIDGVIFQTITNADARITALTTAQIDALTEFPATALTTLEGAENVVVNSAATPGGQLRDIFFNITTEENCPADVGVCSGHPALKDLAVRQALAHAVDKSQIIQVSWLGTATPGLSLVTPAHGDFFASDIEDYAFDIDAANRAPRRGGLRGHRRRRRSRVPGRPGLRQPDLPPQLPR